MSCSRRSTARSCCLGKSGGTSALSFTSLPSARNVLEGEKLDLDCAECGTQTTQFSWPQILGEGLFRFDRRAGRGDDPHLHQKSGDRGQAVGSVATEARVLIKSRLLYQNPS